MPTRHYTSSRAPHIFSCSHTPLHLHLHAPQQQAPRNRGRGQVATFYGANPEPTTSPGTQPGPRCCHGRAFRYRRPVRRSIRGPTGGRWWLGGGAGGAHDSRGLASVNTRRSVLERCELAPLPHRRPPCAALPPQVPLPLVTYQMRKSGQGPMVLGAQRTDAGQPSTSGQQQPGAPEPDRSISEDVRM